MRSWRRLFLQFGALLVVWLVLSGLYDAFHIGLGVASALLVLLMNPPTSLDSEGSRTEPPRWGRLLLYIPWLAAEMLLAALSVARVVITPRMPLSPCLVRFRSRQPGQMARVVLGNSITLTPGTLTIDLAGEEFLVHALTADSPSRLLDESMQTRVARLFTDHPAEMLSNVRIVRSSGDTISGNGLA